MQVKGERVRDALQRVTERDELRGLYRNAQDDQGFKLWGWVQRLLDYLDVDDPGEPGAIFQMLPWLVYGALILVILGSCVWLLLKMRKDLGTDKDEESMEKQRLAWIAEQLQLGREAHRAGDLALALRAFWAALVTGLGRGDELVFRPAWTCREMLARSPGDGPDAQLLGRLLERVERLEFGDQHIEASDVEQLASLCDERLEAVLAMEQRGS